MSDSAVNTESTGSVHATSAPNSVMNLTIDKSIGKQFMLMVWISAVVTAVAVMGMFVAYDAFRVTRQHVKILEYDLMDLRAKTGHAHEGEE